VRIVFKETRAKVFDYGVMGTGGVEMRAIKH